MKTLLEKLFQEENYQPLTIEEISQKLGLSRDDFEELDHTLKQMLDDYDLFLSKKKDRFLLPAHVGVFKGTISIKNEEFGFISSDELEADVYVSRFNYGKALDRDLVLFQIRDFSKITNRDFRQEAKVLKILKRNLTSVVGELKYKKDQYFLNVNHPQIVRLNIVSNDLLAICHEGDIVRVEISDYASSPKQGKIVERLGFKNDIGIDIIQIASNFNFSVEFKQETLAYLDTINQDVSFEISKRRQPSLERIFTIDGDDAKDLDDAVGIKKLDNGNFLLGVYIADVSNYVQENSPLDDEALFRGTSVYLVNRVIPMLPTLLSNNLCSLNPNQPKLVIACEMEINNYGEVISQTIFPSVIKTVYRMTYQNVNLMLSQDLVALDSFSKISSDVFLMSELARILNRMRVKRGALDFNIEEGKIIVDDQGKPIRVELEKRGESERIIEEFMLIANETVASTIYHLDLPFIYRVHEEPNARKLEDFKRLSRGLGYQAFKKQINAKQLQIFLNNLHEKDQFLNTYLLRSMAKAIYSEQNIGHFGLASPCYTHFTSPIRRYPDLLVHRLLRKYLFDQKIDAHEMSFLTSQIEEIARQSSKRERDAIDCEYQVNDMKKAEYMENFIGKRYTGIISSVTKFGVFVSLPNTVEGLVHIKNLRGRYVYDPETISLIGSSNHRLRLGDAVLVEVIGASKIKREIDFKIVYNEDKVITSGKKSNRRSQQKSRS
ncbi:MAG: ribonuclease R [Bacilli bacterium]